MKQHLKASGSLDDYGDFLTVTDVSRLTGIHRNTLYGMIESGQLPAQKMGRTYRFYKNQLREALMKTTIEKNIYRQ
ncbi:MAG: helix-turn-helix domain-containing protein [Pygmaiobacter massiliensis]